MNLQRDEPTRAIRGHEVIMVAVWRQVQKQWQKRIGARKRGVLAVAFAIALCIAYGGTWQAAYGQESPLATPPPAEAPPAEVPPVETPATELPPATFTPVMLPSISGVVSNSDGEPVAGVVVTAYRRQQANWATARQTTTNVAGEYRFPWMSAGSYRLLMRDPQGNYATIYYPGAADIEAAEDVVVLGTALPNMDAAISEGGRITGTLSWPDGPTPFDSLVELYYLLESPYTTRLTLSDDVNLPPELRQYRLVASQSFTEPVVSYEFTGLAAGRYRVCAEAVALRATAHECFDDAALGIHSTDVVVTTGATVANVEIELGDGADLATLRGAVVVSDTLAGTRPAEGVDVEVIAAPNVDFFVSPQPQRTTTDAAGNFHFDELPFGRYVVRFTDSDGLYLASDYRATPEATAATVISLARSSEVTISAVISAASLITGHVTIDDAIAGMGGQVAAYGMGETGWFIGGTGNIVAATGAYTVTGLRGGDYRLQYTVDIPTSIFYGEPGATLETATEISVMTGTSVGGIVMDLTPYIAGIAYGSISGQIVMEGAPQPDMVVMVYDAGGDCCIAPSPFVVTTTDAEGRYNVVGLPPGRYKVGVGAVDQANASLYAPDQRTYETATIYTIGHPADGVARQSITDVNIALGPVGSVARLVLRPDDSPVVGATVNLYQRLGDAGNWPLVATTQTDEEGRYRFAGVVPDIYQVCIVAAGMTEPSCGGRGGQGVGLDVLVTAGQEATGIDILDVP
jgi:5-hydroxyisourate hydrolase-like protein (transthyretin family)